jgi:ubiquinol-cytochrome c reductase iron-sulfur subunit
VGGAGHRRALRQHLRPVRACQGGRRAVEADISALKPGEKITVEWRGKPVWIVRRTPEQLAALKKLDPQLADPKSERNPVPDARLREERAPLDQARVPGGRGHLLAPGLLAVGQVQPGAQPSLPDDWQGGFLCPCHGSTFDLAGRVFKNKPAPDNLEVPPHMYLSDTRC